MEDLGYGVKAFTISLVENAIKVSDGKVPARVIGRAVELGKTLLRLDAKPLEEVETPFPPTSNGSKKAMLTASFSPPAAAFPAPAG